MMHNEFDQLFHSLFDYAEAYMDLVNIIASEDKLMKDRPLIQALTWKDVRDSVHKVNPDFAKQVDAVSPSKEFTVYRVRYSFGQYILKNGTLQLPLEKTGELVSIGDNRLSKKINQDLGYTPNMPIGVVLHNTCELFWDIDGGIIPTIFMLSGRIFALWVMLQEPGTSAHTGRMWQITAGARSLVMLPKISDAVAFERLRKDYNLYIGKPRNLLEHWQIFKALVDSPSFGNTWETEVLYFSKKWWEQISDSAWLPLRAFLLETAWKDTSFLRDRQVLEFAFSKAQIEKNLRPDPHNLSTAMHILFIAYNAYLGFKIATNDEAGPICKLQKVFLETYQLKFAPTIVQPAILQNVCKRNPVYYSLGFPTKVVFSSRKKSTKYTDLKELENIIRTICAYIQEDQLGLKDTPIYRVVTDFEFKFFSYTHTASEPFLFETGQLPAFDLRLAADLKRFPDKPFSVLNPFVNGLVSIKAKV